MRTSVMMVLIAALFIPACGKQEADMMLEPGSAAPEFTLSSHSGDRVSLRDFRGSKYVVLIFYPGNETPGCTQQLCEIRDEYPQFKERDAVVFGVNPAKKGSHEKFAANHKFQFPLLVDEKRAVAAAYGAKGAVMTKRTVYVIDKTGTIIFAQRGKPPVSEILEAIIRHAGRETEAGSEQNQ